MVMELQIIQTAVMAVIMCVCTVYRVLSKGGSFQCIQKWSLLGLVWRYFMCGLNRCMRNMNFAADNQIIW